MCFHVLRSHTAWIHPKVTILNSLAILERLHPSAYLARIRVTSPMVSLEFGCLSPMAPRPFKSRSSVFPCEVVMKRCLGLMQRGLSHLWATTSASLISALIVRWAINLWAVKCLALRQTFPYPPGFRGPSKFQQPFWSSVNRTKLSLFEFGEDSLS